MNSGLCMFPYPRPMNATIRWNSNFLPKINDSISTNLVNRWGISFPKIIDCRSCYLSFIQPGQLLYRLLQCQYPVNKEKVHPHLQNSGYRYKNYAYCDN